MDLRDYLKPFSDDELARFALSCGTTVGHLSNVRYGMRTASAALTRQIALQTKRAVPEWHLRPKDWHLIWPELVDSPGSPPVPALSDSLQA